METGEKNSASQRKNDAQHFTFVRMGGIDQLTLRTDYDWQHLDELDPKLWLALSCPTRGLEFDSATLQLLDQDGDGRIRADEVRDAVRWVCVRLIHPSQLTDCVAEVRLDNVRDDTPEGQSIAAAMKLALKEHGADEKPALPLATIDEVLAEAADYPFNGDGIITVASAEAAAQKNKGHASAAEFIRLGLALVGGKKDASGLPGLDNGLAEEVVARAEAYSQWQETVKATELPLGDKTAQAWDCMVRLGKKLDDYFCRTQMASFAPESLAAVNEEQRLQNLTVSTDGVPIEKLDHATLLSFPLAKVTATPALNLVDGINPAWLEEIKTFAALFAPLRSDAKTLTRENWENIKAKFAPYATMLESKPTYPLPPQDAQAAADGLVEASANDPLGRAFLPSDPNQTLDSLTAADLKLLTSKDTLAQFKELVAQDESAPPLAAFQDLRKLALFHGHLYTFLMNFLSFMDFYDPQKRAMFQTGTLYLDSRACDLCVPVDDIDAHARLADPSHLCLIYCDCTRKASDGAEEKCTIAAALTQGNLASLLDGRHGLFIDNDGKEWDSRIARIVHNPVSLKEAAWSPYIRIGNMINEQIQKFVASKEEDVTKMADKTIGSVAAGQKPAEPKAGFDFAKGAGIFAALGLALSAVSAAFAYIAHSLAALGWWWPLALVMVLICISAPSMFLAWLKLRRRTLGPLLDASGWAVNQGAPINLTMGASLTSVGKLPPNAHCDLNDPYSLPGKLLARKWKTRFWLTVFLLIVLAIGGFWLYCQLLGEPLWFFQLRAMLNI